MAALSSLQRGLSPNVGLRLQSKFEIAALSRPLERVGGDWWTVRCVSETRIVVVVGDGGGHGMLGATSGAVAKAAVEALLRRNDDTQPATIVSAVDAAFDHLGSSWLFTTCVVAVIDCERGTASFVSSGHPFPYLIADDPETGWSCAAVVVRGAICGMGAVGERPPVTVPLRPGTTVAFYTDGLIERAAPARRALGHRGLAEVLVQAVPGTSLPLACDRVMRAAEACADADDDATLLLVRVPGE